MSQGSLFDSVQDQLFDAPAVSRAPSAPVGPSLAEQSAAAQEVHDLWADRLGARTTRGTVKVKLPKGWRGEVMGLSESVQFTSPGGMSLVWCDGTWTMGRGSVHMSARGVPSARTMAEARTVGTAWIAENDE
jgi:hypothetical protein